jgi:hypothetical protein
MRRFSPDPNPIPPEMPLDPSRNPAPDMPINVPPEKGPGRPEPLPPGPMGPTPVVRGAPGAVFAAVLLASGMAWAQHPAGKDTSELEKGNPQQTICSQITSAAERQRCLRENQPSGAPATGKPDEARQPPQTGPGVGREMRPVPYGETKTPANPDAPARSSR